MQSESKHNKSAFQKPKRSRSTLENIIKNYQLYLFLLPALVVIFLFTYIPMYGVQIAFRNFVPAKGIWDSEWVGLTHFIKFFNSYQFNSLIKNTLALSIYSVVATFPIPIIIALSMNQMKAARFKKTLQTVSYMPHFISLVVLVGMLQLFLSPSTGMNAQLSRLFGVDAKNLLGSTTWFSSLYVWSDVWQHAGWDSIIYVAALSAVDPSLYESAKVDGANKFHQLLYIDFPSIVPTMIILLILKVGNVMSIGFEKVYLMQNALNTPVSEIISTYVYKIGIESSQYSYSAAVGLFNTVINLVLLLSVNLIATKTSDISLW